MHCRREGSTIEERSLASGPRKATFTRAGPQPTMFAWFQRSTQVRMVWAEETTSGPLFGGDDESVVAQADAASVVATSTVARLFISAKIRRHAWNGRTRLRRQRHYPRASA